MDMHVGRALGLSAIALLLPVCASAATPVEIAGSTQATLRWEPASGPVAGYYVIVSRDGGTPQVAGVSDDVEEVVDGAYGEVLTVQVAAFDAEGVAGPTSPESEPFTFVAPTSGDAGSGGGGEDPSTGDPDSAGGGAGEPVFDAKFDLTGDGRSDLLVLRSGAVELWAMQGAAVQAVLALPPVPEDARLVGSGDYDANGTTDLLWELPTSGVRRLWLLSEGAVTASGELDGPALEGDADWRVAGTGDFDADGSEDILLASRVLGAAEIWFMDGAAVAAHGRIPGRVGAWSVAGVLDADADGASEILWRDELAHVLELDDPDGAGPLPVADSIEGWRVAATGEMDGDGRRELLLREQATEALELWTLDGANVTDIRRVAVGAWAGWSPSAPGDYDGDGADDWVWHDPVTGEVAVALSSPQDPTPQLLGRTLPPDATLVSGVRVAGDAAFFERFCSGDLDGDAAVTPSDHRILKGCLSSAATGVCESADLDGDGVVTRTDAKIFRDRFVGRSCE